MKTFQNAEWYETYHDLDSAASDMAYFIRNEKFVEAALLLEASKKLAVELREQRNAVNG